MGKRFASGTGVSASIEFKQMLFCVRMWAFKSYAHVKHTNMCWWCWLSLFHHFFPLSFDLTVGNRDRQIYTRFVANALQFALFFSACYFCTELPWQNAFFSFLFSTSSSHPRSLCSSCLSCCLLFVFITVINKRHGTFITLSLCMAVLFYKTIRLLLSHHSIYITLIVA